MNVAADVPAYHAGNRRGQITTRGRHYDTTKLGIQEKRGGSDLVSHDKGTGFTLGLPWDVDAVTVMVRQHGTRVTGFMD